MRKAWNICSYELNKHVDVILVCKMNEMVGIKMAIVLV